MTNKELIEKRKEYYKRKYGKEPITFCIICRKPIFQDDAFTFYGGHPECLECYLKFERGKEEREGREEEW